MSIRVLVERKSIGLDFPKMHKNLCIPALKNVQK